MSHRILKSLLPLLTGALVIAAWYGAHGWLSPDMRFLLPTPDAVVGAMRENADDLWRATLNTAQGALVGFAIATALSFVLAVVLSLSPLIRASLYPYLMILQMMPVIVIAPILIVWVGPGLKSVTIITVLICFFPLVVNTTQGLISTDAHSVGAMNNVKFGVAMARRGWVRRGEVLNTLPLRSFQKAVKPV